MADPTSARQSPTRRNYTLIGVWAVALSVFALAATLISHLSGSVFNGSGHDSAQIASAPRVTSADLTGADPAVADSLSQQAEDVWAQGGSAVESVYVDRAGKVVVVAALPDNLVAVQRAVINFPDVRVEPVTGRAAFLAGDVAVTSVDGLGGALSTRSGRAVTGPVGGEPLMAGSRRCSAGFNATRGRQPVLLTAAHCLTGAAGVRYGNTFLGAVGAADPARTDIGYVTTTTALSGPAVIRTTPGSTIKVSGVAAPRVGAKLCKSGAVTGWTCGRVLATEVSVRVALSGGRSTLMRGLIKTDACAVAGDSGGPVVAGSTAIGLTSAAVTPRGRCGQRAGQPTVTYVQPLTSALRALGLVLRTS